LKCWEIIQKNEIGDKLIKTFHKSRLIPISNTNWVTSLDYIKSQEYHTKIAKNIFLETFYQTTNKERRSNTCTHNFIPKTKLHPVSQGNISLTLHYLKRFTKSTKITLSKIHNYTKTLESNKNINKTQQNSHLQSWNPTRQHLETEERSNLVDGSP